MMVFIRLSTVFCSVFLVVNESAWAQSNAEHSDEPDAIEVDDEPSDQIRLVAQRQPGVVIGNIEPELVISADEIETMGVSSLGELLEELSADTSSGRGRSSGSPVVLLNGRRISGFREIRQYPPEALSRVEVLPEEVALKYGYRADQRVVNFVLKPNVTVRAIEIEAESPIKGGRTVTEGSARQLWVNGDKRFSLDVTYFDRSPLFESERNVISEQPDAPYSIEGNIQAAIPGEEISTALSDAAGNVVTIASVPAGAGTLVPTLNDFLPGANAQSFTDLSTARTLLAESDELATGTSFSRKVFGEVIGSLSGRVTSTSSTASLGLGTVALTIPSANPFSSFSEDVSLFRYVNIDGPLLSETETLDTNLGFGLVSGPGGWNWSVTGNYIDTRTETDVDAELLSSTAQALLDGNDVSFNPYGDLSSGVTTSRQQTERDSRFTEISYSINGSLLELPAGDISSTLQIGADHREQETVTLTDGDVSRSELSRERVQAQLNLDIPLVTIDDEKNTWLGEWSANGNILVEDLSDFGTLTTYGYGLTWDPIEKVSLIFSATHEEGAPSLEQLNSPIITSPNQRYFDFTTGETVFVRTTIGGNDTLVADNRSVYKIGLSAEPFEDTDVRFSIDYTNSTIENEARSFPSGTAEIQAAFPDRFIRDAFGTLVEVDLRPINAEEVRREQIRSGFRWQKRLSQQRSERSSGARTAGGGTRGEGATPRREAGSASARSSDTRRGASSTGRPPSRPQRPGRVRFSLFHTYWMKDEVTIRQDLPTLDFLNGSGLNQSGGQPEHEIQYRADYWNKGIGARLSGEWRSSTTVDDLRFSDRFMLNSRFTYDFQHKAGLINTFPWLSGTRLALRFDNILNERIDVTTKDGTTPSAYQPDLVDPLGRTIEFELRKRF